VYLDPVAATSARTGTQGTTNGNKNGKWDGERKVRRRNQEGRDKCHTPIHLHPNAFQQHRYYSDSKTRLTHLLNVHIDTRQ